MYQTPEDKTATSIKWQNMTNWCVVQGTSPITRYYCAHNCEGIDASSTASPWHRGNVCPLWAVRTAQDLAILMSTKAIPRERSHILLLCTSCHFSNPNAQSTCHVLDITRQQMSLGSAPMGISNILEPLMELLMELLTRVTWMAQLQKAEVCHLYIYLYKGVK